MNTLGDRFPKIRIEPSGIMSHKVYADGTELDYIRSVNVDIDALEIPTVTIEFASAFAFDEMARLECVLHPDSITECVKGIQFEMRMDSDFRDAVKASILSAITDSDWESADGLADAILERVFLGER